QRIDDVDAAAIGVVDDGGDMRERVLRGDRPAHGVVDRGGRVPQAIDAGHYPAGGIVDDGRAVAEVIDLAGLPAGAVVGKGGDLVVRLGDGGQLAINIISHSGAAGGVPLDGLPAGIVVSEGDPADRVDDARDLAGVVVDRGSGVAQGIGDGCWPAV